MIALFGITFVTHLSVTPVETHKTYTQYINYVIGYTHYVIWSIILPFICANYTSAACASRFYTYMLCCTIIFLKLFYKF